VYTAGHRKLRGSLGRVQGSESPGAFAKEPRRQLCGGWLEWSGALGLRSSERVSSMSNHARAKLLFLVAAFLSFLLSVGLWFSGHRDEGVFVGIWVPSILALGALMLGGKSSK